MDKHALTNMRSRSRIRKKKRTIFYARRVIHSLLGAITGWLATAVVTLVIFLGFDLSLPNIPELLKVVLGVTFLGWCLIGLPIALTFSKHAARNISCVVTRYFMATTTTVIALALISLLMFGTETIAIIIFIAVPSILWAAGIGVIGGIVFCTLQQRVED